MVIRREYGSLFSLMLSFVLVAHLRLYAINGKVTLSISWLVAGGVFMSMWLIVRILRLLKRL